MKIIKEEISHYIRYGYYDAGGFMYHREDGPAKIFPDGTQRWYSHGKRHREDGPAVIHANGEERWYKNDKIHREDGPALIWDDKKQFHWFINDTDVNTRVNQWLEDHDIDNWENMSEEDELAFKFYMTIIGEKHG